jgi:hypothetical protein
MLVATVLGLGVSELITRAFLPVPHVGPAFTVYDPLYGKRMRPSFTATRSSPEYRFTVRTNSLGLRGPEPRAGVAGGLLFIGDSFTLGYGVEDDESFPARIEARLRARGLDVPVLNAGMGNSGNGHWIKLLEHEAPAWAPRLVVLQMMANDFSDNLREGLFELDVDGHLQELPVQPPSFARRAQDWIERVPGLGYAHLVALAWSTSAAIQRRARSKLDLQQHVMDRALAMDAANPARADARTGG